MKLNSKNLVLNLLGTDANIQINKKILLILKLEEAFFLSLCNFIFNYKI